MVWIHVGVDLLWLALDVAWLIVVMRWTRKLLWRVAAGVFIAMQMAEVLNELIGRLGMVRVDLSNIPKWLITVIVVWHFFGLITFIGLCLAAAGQRLIHRLRPKPVQLAGAAPAPNAVSRRQFFGVCATFAPPLLTFGISGIALNQLDTFRLRRFTLSMPSLPKQLDGLTIAHLSDIHVGEWTHGAILQDIVDATNALCTDIVVMTGDLINYELSDLSEAIYLLKKMQGRYGQWMVEGNHDMLEDGLEFERRVRASGLQLLLDESSEINIRGYPVQFFGLRWMDGVGSNRDNVTTMQMRALMEKRDPDAFPIFLAHHPHAFDAAVDAKLPLTLTGHTHGGQLMLGKDVGIGPALFRYWSGHYQRNDSQLIVSNGVGNMFPVRINAPAEIAHITLRSVA
jgi:predicted MPP superfamily phosphohydrolase